MSLYRWNDEDVDRMRRVLGRTATVLRKLGHKRSVRARQRAIAFYLAHSHWNGFINGEELREWCKLLDAYNAANFAQNMTKEAKRGLVTGNIRRDGGWRLTVEGERYARELADSIDSMAAQIEASMKGIVVKAKACRCALCQDTVHDHEDHVKCRECGMRIHSECNEEMRHGSRRCPSNLCPGNGDDRKALSRVEDNVEEHAA